MNEVGVDIKFSDLPKLAQLEAHRIWEEAQGSTYPLQILSRELDRSMEFREAIGVRDMDVLPQEVDSVVRHFKYNV
jgi:hypothetical protein